MTISALAVTMILVMIAALLVVILFSIPLFIRLTLQVLDTTIGGSLSLTCCGVGLHLALGEAGRTLTVVIAGRACIPLPLAVVTARTGGREKKGPGTQQKALLTRILRQAPDILPFVCGLLQDVTLKRCSGAFRIGLGSAADTGRLFGYYAAIRPILLASRRLSFSLVPVFDHQVMQGNLTVDLTFSRPLVHIFRLFRLFRLLEARERVPHHPGSNTAV